jgi:hypothetical protein
MIATVGPVFYIVASYPKECEKIRHLIPFAKTPIAFKEPYKQAKQIVL